VYSIITSSPKAGRIRTCESCTFTTSVPPEGTVSPSAGIVIISYSEWTGIGYCAVTPRSKWVVTALVIAVIIIAMIRIGLV